MTSLPVVAATAALLLLAAGAWAQAPSAEPARGPLKVLPDNPRYFTDGSGRAVYLTGSHVWRNLKDLGPGPPPPVFDYDDYLARMKRFGHNFMRLWTWELAKYNYNRIKNEMHYSQPFPWPRTGPGKALDGGLTFDLSRLDDAYLDRLRKRVVQAGERGIYVSVMLFEGHGVQCSDPPWCWDGHPFNAKNNINNIDGNPNGDERGTEVHTLAVPAVTRIQEAYVRKIIDTVGDLDNVLYEVANEAGSYSTEWQYHIIHFVKEVEKGRAKQHPVGMTFQYKGGRNKTLFDGPADWISPNPAGGYRDNPPAADGRKVILSDTDHLWGIGGSRDWVWKTFLRGMNPIYMDDYVNWIGRDTPPQDEIRRAMGHTLAYARRMDLAKMMPRGDLASSGYCLAAPGREILVYQSKGGAVKVTLPDTPAAWSVEWFDAAAGKVAGTDKRTAAEATEFSPPIKGPAVLYLKAAQ